MTLATATADGSPSARVVLLKGADERGFVVLHRLSEPEGARARGQSARGAGVLLGRAGAAGAGERRRGAGSRDENEAYFLTRPRGSRLGAWASQQSTVIAGAGGARRAAAASGGPVRRRRRAAAAALGRIPGAARRRSSSGRAGRTGCTTGSGICARSRGVEGGAALAVATDTGARGRLRKRESALIVAGALTAERITPEAACTACCSLLH